MKHVLDATVSRLRAAFNVRDVPTVQTYAGEFNAAEVERLSFTAPAVLPTVLGWMPVAQPKLLQGQRGVRQVRMAAFVLSKHANRDQRMAMAMAIADLAAHALTIWRPEPGGDVTLTRPLEDPRCENLYGRAVDKHGLALWLLTWDVEARPERPLPELYDLTAVEIIDTTLQGIAPASVPLGPSSLLVTEDVGYAPLPAAE